jgi:hypothetical protein
VGCAWHTQGQSNDNSDNSGYQLLPVSFAFLGRGGGGERNGSCTGFELRASQMRYHLGHAPSPYELT